MGKETDDVARLLSSVFPTGQPSALDQIGQPPLTPLVPPGVDTSSHEMVGRVAHVQIISGCWGDIADISADHHLIALGGEVVHGVAQVGVVLDLEYEDDIPDDPGGWVDIIGEAREQMEIQLGGMAPFKIIGVFKHNVSAAEMSEVLSRDAELQFVIGGEVEYKADDSGGLEPYHNVIALSLGSDGQVKEAEINDIDE